MHPGYPISTASSLSGAYPVTSGSSICTSGNVGVYGQAADSQQYITGQELPSQADWSYQPPAKRMHIPHPVDCVATTYSGASSSRGTHMMCAEDEEKKRVRRERNKIAAAKCRQRRVDLTNKLQDETDQLEVERAKLTEDIRDLQREKEQLEFVLQAHRPICKMEAIPMADCPIDLKVYRSSERKSECSSTTSPERPSCLEISVFKGGFDLNTPVFSDNTPSTSKKPETELLLKTEPVELHTPTWSEGSSQSYHKPSRSSTSSSSNDINQGASNSTARKRSSSGSNTSETKSPVRTFFTL